MRKTQQKIIERAKKINLPSNIIDMLSDEKYSIATLRNIYDFYYYHREETDNPEIYFEIQDFFMEIHDRTYRGTLFYRFSISNILWIKEQYKKGIFSVDDVAQLSYIHVNLYQLDFEKTLAFFHERKEMLKSFPEYDNADILWVSLCCLYFKFPAVPLESLINIEANVLKSGKIDLKDEIYIIINKTGNIFQEEAEKYLTRDLKPLLEEIERHYEFRCQDFYSYHYNDRNFYCRCYPDTRTVDSIKQIMKLLPELSEEKFRKMTLEAVDPKPYAISVKSSMTGVSIEFKTYGLYKMVGEKILLDKQEDLVKILFTYDCHCFLYNTRLKRWVPITLSQIAALYHYGFWKDVFNSYADIATQKGMVWKDIKKSLNDGSGMPPLTANDVLFFRTKKDMMLSMYKKSDIINWNRKDLYTGYLAMKAVLRVRESDKNILLDYVNKNELSFSQARIDVNVNNLLSQVILSRLKQYGKDFDEEDTAQMLRDYLFMSKDLHRKISLSFHSPVSLQEAHDEVMILHRDKHTEKVKIPAKTKFTRLRKLLPDEFEWITSRRRLITEGVEMHHCVASYAHKINQDKCAIYSVMYKNKRYTIEFLYNKDKDTYYVAQIQGKYDSGHPKAVRKYVESFLAA